MRRASLPIFLTRLRSLANAWIASGEANNETMKNGTEALRAPYCDG